MGKQARGESKQAGEIRARSEGEKITCSRASPGGTTSMLELVGNNLGKGEGS